MVQASISNERDFDRVAEALIIQHPRIPLRGSQRRAKGRGKDGFKRADNSNTRWLRGKGTGKHAGSGNSGTTAHHANLTSLLGPKDEQEIKIKKTGWYDGVFMAWNMKQTKDTWSWQSKNWDLLQPSQ